jgi:DNA-nicking Smr family endonuclease
MSKKKGDLSDEERDLWITVTRAVKPLRSPKETPRTKPGPGREGAAESVNPGGRVRVVAPKQPPTPPPSVAPAISHGSAAGLDRRQAERFKRGKTPIEGRLDLHGMTQPDAQDALRRFVAGAAASGKRCVLVITGKGRASPDGGVLRKEVPRWLNEPSLREKVLSFDYAQPKDGGTGALYVLLRRRRS